MRKITLFLTVLFMALVVKAQSTTTYDFKNWPDSEVSLALGEKVGTAWETGNQLYQGIYQCTTIGLERFAFQAVSPDYTGKGYWFRVGYGIAAVGATRSMALLGLSSGDVVTITATGTVDLTGGGSGDGTWTVENTDGSNVYTVTMTSDGNLGMCLQLDKSNRRYITSISVTTSSETIETPKCTITSAYNNERTITITPAESGSLGTAIGKTYYTIDGTDPSESNGTEYTAPFTISETTTIKAISYLENGVASFITTFVAEAGFQFSLNNDVVRIGGLADGEGDEKKPIIEESYVNDGVIGNPEVSFSYTFNGEEVTLPYTVTEDGTLVATASADGYASATETLEVNASYIAVKSADFTTITEDNLVEVLGDTWSITATDTRWSGWDKSQGDIYTIATCSNSANLTDFIGSTCGTMIVGYGLARNHNSATEYWINNPEEGQIAVYEVNEAKTATTDFVKYTVAYTDNAKLSHSIYNVNAIAKVTLYSPARELVVTDGEDLNAEGTYTNATYERLFNTEHTYGTICLPFAPDAETCENYTFYKLMESNSQTLYFEEETEPKANVAYLYKLNDGVDAEEAKTFTGGVTTIAEVESEAVGGWQLIGSFKEEKITDLTDGKYYVYKPEYNGKKNVFVKATNSLTVKPYRAYFKFVETQSLNFAPAAAVMFLSIGGEYDGTNEIEKVVAPEEVEGAVFDMEGRPVEKMQEGKIYIVGGQKVIK